VLKEPSVLATWAINAPADTPDTCTAGRLKIIAYELVDYLSGIR
jgi:hypothetical protein